MASNQIQSSDTTDTISLANTTEQYLAMPTLSTKGLKGNVTIYVIVILVSAFFALIFGIASRNVKKPTASGGIKFLEILVVGICIIVLLGAGFQYIFGVQINASLNRLFKKNPEIDLGIKTSSTSEDSSGSGKSGSKNVPTSGPKQVFHVDGQYDYNNAKAVCKAYGGRLANISDMMNAYNDGAEWCMYGWSSDQMALYPTQYSTWNQYQTIDGYKDTCGRPGINGGYINDKSKRLGANCYGKKPLLTGKSRTAMNSGTIYPESLYNKQQRERVDYWKKQLGDIVVSPFNYNSWNE